MNASRAYPIEAFTNSEHSEARISPNDQTRAAQLACFAEARRLLRATQDNRKARLWMPSQHKEFDTFGR